MSLHYLQDDVAADGVPHQDDARFLRDMFLYEGQLVFNLPIQAKHIRVGI